MSTKGDPLGHIPSPSTAAAAVLSLPVLCCRRSPLPPPQWLVGWMANEAHCRVPSMAIYITGI